MKAGLPIPVFVDETGLVHTKNQQFIGVGALIIYKNHLALNQELRNVFLDAIQHLRAVEATFEFKFTFITKQSFPYYLEIADILEKRRSYWDFSSLLEKRTTKKFWEHYILILDQLLSGKQKFIVLADHLNKPRKARHGLSDIEKANHIERVIQLESQGSILLQTADILLGAAVYEKRGGKDKYKLEIAERINSIRKQKREPV